MSGRQGTVLGESVEADQRAVQLDRVTERHQENLQQRQN